MLTWRTFWRSVIVSAVAIDIDRIRRRTGGTLSGAVAVDTFHTHTIAGRWAWFGFWAWFGWHIGWGQFVETPEWARR